MWPLELKECKGTLYGFSPSSQVLNDESATELKINLAMNYLMNLYGWEIELQWL